ncbi:MAG: LysR family transcriptional regulator [Epsilonproteobacteria bacterium]|nr:LysR family transcriptional regulator [Campylobacterota bacterium]
MMKYIDKIHAFLVVYETKSFSKASKILKISQPAVTQKIKQLEEFVGSKLIERKKNGIILTTKGKYFLEIALHLRECVDKVSNRIKYFKEASIPFVVGASLTVGNYVLPNYIPYLSNLIKKDINLIVKNNNVLAEQLLNNEIDIAFMSAKINKPNIHYIPWKEDKIVFFSNKPLPSTIEFEDLTNYEFICREDGSTLKEQISNILKSQNKACNHLNITSYVDNSTALKFTILNAHKQYISIISYNAIKDEVDNKRLYLTKVKGLELHRTIYIAFCKQTPEIDQIINYLSNKDV